MGFELATLEHFHFLRPAWALLLIPWLMMIWVHRRRRAQRDRFGGIIAPHLLEHLRLQPADTRRFNPASVAPMLMLTLLLVLMGPTWRQQPSPLIEDEATLVLLLDVSASMQQTDIQPSRLQRARQKISDLLALRPGKQGALVVYSGSAHTVLSLTGDRDILQQYLAAVEPGIMPRSGKFPEYTLPLADDILRDTTAPSTLVLFSDGLGADSLHSFRQWFAQRPHQLVVVGVGSEQATDDLAPLEREQLEALADAAGGRYINLSVDDSDMQRVSRLIDDHFVIVEDSALPWLDSGYPLIFPALALFLLWFRKGWTLTWGWLLLPLALHSGPAQVQAQTLEANTGATQHPALEWFADLWLTPDQQGRLLLQLGHYRAAAQQFDNPDWKGLAYYYNEQFMLAAEYFSRSDSDDALFNEANARAQARDYVRAVLRYDRLLKRSPDYPGAAQNRAIAQRIIDDSNRLSESQRQEPGTSSTDRELGKEEAVPALGADELAWDTAQPSRYSAEEILGNPATREMWLRGVQTDPSNFLASKFSMQLQRREHSGQSAQ